MPKLTTLLLLCTALFAQQKGTFTRVGSQQPLIVYEQQKGTFTDKRDGKIYKTAKIGEQVWMAENLNYEASGKCYGNKPANCGKYGRLYDWNTAMKACPKFWHLPSNVDWDRLVHYVDDTSGTSSPYDSPTAGEHLKATIGWNDCKYCNDNYGFSALSGGVGTSDGIFDHIGYYGYWWSSSEFDSSNAYFRFMGHIYYGVFCQYDDKSNLLSVRCIQDTPTPPKGSAK